MIKVGRFDFARVFGQKVRERPCGKDTQRADHAEFFVEVLLVNRHAFPKRPVISRVGPDSCSRIRQKPHDVRLQNDSAKFVRAVSTRVKTSDHGPHTGTDDTCNRDLLAFQHLEDADVSDALGSSTGKDEDDSPPPFLILRGKSGIGVFDVFREKRLFLAEEEQEDHYVKRL